MRRRFCGSPQAATGIGTCSRETPGFQAMPPRRLLLALSFAALENEGLIGIDDPARWSGTCRPDCGFGFMRQVNYPIPVFGALLGWLLLGRSPRSRRRR